MINIRNNKPLNKSIQNTMKSQVKIADINIKNLQKQKIELMKR